MNGPWGRRGNIISRFGWSWDYLHYEISWTIVMRMLADGPRYDYDNDNNDGENIVLTDENAEAIAAMLNK